MSRAEKDRQQAQRELGQQLQKFARDLAAGRTAFVDRFGAKVDKGDYVIYQPPHDLIFEVMDVTPVLDPRVGVVGAVTVRLVSTTDIQFIASQRAMNVIKCGTQAKAQDGTAIPGEADIKPAGSEQPHEPPTDLPAPGEPIEQPDEPPSPPLEGDES